MITLSSALSIALGGPVQQPAIFVQMDFSTPRRWSSFATTSWNGQTWTQGDVQIDGLSSDPLIVRSRLTVGNSDDVIGALLLSEGATDRRVQVWGYDAAAVALADVVPLIDAVGGATSIQAQKAIINLRAPGELLQCPRRFVGSAAGFTSLLPPGFVMKINGIEFTLDRR